jgi:hypothetical protein
MAELTNASGYQSPIHLRHYEHREAITLTINEDCFVANASQWI